MMNNSAYEPGILATESVAQLRDTNSEHLRSSNLIQLAQSCAEVGNISGALQNLTRIVDVTENYTEWYKAAILALRFLKKDWPAPVKTRAKIYICNSSTTLQLAPLLTLAGLRDGMLLEVVNGEYGQYRQELLDPHSALYKFQPDVILLAVHAGDTGFPTYSATPEAAVDEEFQGWASLWDTASKCCGARLVMFNFALPPEDPFGHLSARLPGTRSSMIMRLNARITTAARDQVAIVDCERLSSNMGRTRWFSPRYWNLSRQSCSFEALPILARHVSAVVAGQFGLGKKCIAVDLDNTLWGGVVGEDGIEGICIGPEDPEGRSYTEFQLYLKALKERGILLAVCSKNNDKDAREPFLKRSEMILTLDDFVLFKANWKHKYENIRDIATELNIGLESIVFLDDNPAEREIIRQIVPEVEVVVLPADPAHYVRALSAYPLFEVASYTAEDAARTQLYRSRADILEAKRGATSVEEFLISLNMAASIEPFHELNIARVTQLIGKTNQFNLTTQRYSISEVKALASDPNVVHMALRLKDRFADHGLVGVLIGRCESGVLSIDLWALSCRVIGRTAEVSMLSALVRVALTQGCFKIRGVYVPSAKNTSVEQLYSKLGFDPTGEKNEYTLNTERYIDPKQYIEILDHLDGGKL